MRTATQHGDRAAVTALVVGGILAGGNPVGVWFTVLELDALWGAALRFALASLLLAGMMAVLRLSSGCRPASRSGGWRCTGC